MDAATGLTLSVVEVTSNVGRGLGAVRRGVGAASDDEEGAAEDADRVVDELADEADDDGVVRLTERDDDADGDENVAVGIIMAGTTF